MVDLASRDGLELDAQKLALALGVPVVPTVAVRKRGLDALLDELAQELSTHIDAPEVPQGRAEITKRAHEISARRNCQRNTRTRASGRGGSIMSCCILLAA
jgi:ferrous iron transport protein B